MSNFSPNLIYSFDEITHFIYESRSTRTCDRPVVLTPIAGDFNAGVTATFKSCKDETKERQNRAKRSNSDVKMNRTWRSRSLIENVEEKNRLRGGATIVAKLPYSRCLDGTGRRPVENRRKGETTKCSSDLASMSSVSSTPRPQLLSLGSTRVRATSSSGQSSSEKGCCPYHIRVRRRNTTSESNGGQDTEMVVTAPRCRCSEPNSIGHIHSALSGNTTSALTYKPPVSSRLPHSPKRALSIEDAIVQLSKRSNSPPSDFTGSSSSSSNHKKIVHRTLSTNRITDELRAKLGLTPPHKRGATPKPSGQLLTPYKRPGSYERIMNGHAIGTQTVMSSPGPTRSYSDSQLDLMARNNKIRCSRCFHYCPLEEGCFTCDTCIEVQRVKNAFVIEIFADRPSCCDDSRPEQMTCYGVRVGAGILPVVVMFVSLILCSVVLLSDAVMSNVCGHYCGVPPNRGGITPRTSVWGWLE